MKGFTARTSRQTREENARMLALHDALLLPVLHGFRGRKIKGMGDALLAAFDSPTDAVLCATAMQDRLAGWNRRAPADEHIEVRDRAQPGRGAAPRGDAPRRGDPAAAPAEARADAGEVVLTDAVYLSMTKSEAPTEIVAERPLRGGGRMRLRRVARGEDPAVPYGGGALSRLRRLPDPARAVRFRVAAESLLEFARKRAVWAAAGLLLIAAAAGERVTRGSDPTRPPARRHSGSARAAGRAERAGSAGGTRRGPMSPRSRWCAERPSTPSASSDRPLPTSPPPPSRTRG